MDRRELLAASTAGLAVGIAGCLTTLEIGSAGGPSENESTDERNDGRNGLHVVGVYADERDREFIDGEYLALRNSADDALNVSGYRVEYGADHAHRIADLVLESGARLALVSRSGTDSTLLSSPPTYLRYASFDTGSTASVLDESGTVRVKDGDGSLITEVRYEDFGCDGGTVTTASGEEAECLQ